MPRGAIVAVAMLLAGCGVPHELPKQAEEVESIAAEAALLAHDAAEGDTLASYRRAHGRALARQLSTLRAAIDDVELAGVAQRVAADLARLVAEGGDEDVAAALERRLESAAEDAGEIAR